MREIKFRGKSTGDQGKWIYGYYYFDRQLKSHRILDAVYLKSYEVIPETVGQFVCHINGKEIYDGDRVLTYRWRSGEGVITFGTKKCGFYISCPKADFESDRRIALSNIKEVVGNIHENKYSANGEL